MNDCVFCDILADKLPSSQVEKEDDMTKPAGMGRHPKADIPTPTKKPKNSNEDRIAIEQAVDQREADGKSIVASIIAEQTGLTYLITRQKLLEIGFEMTNDYDPETNKMVMRRKSDTGIKQGSSSKIYCPNKMRING